LTDTLNDLVTSGAVNRDPFGSYLLSFAGAQ
jgi:hypothetical protein